MFKHLKSKLPPASPGTTDLDFADPKFNPQYPEWAKPENLRWAWWGWEPRAHRRRMGAARVPFLGSVAWIDQWESRLRSRETVKMMKDLGITMGITKFFKGFGLKFEKKEMEEVRQLAALCHEHNIKLVGYTGTRSIYQEKLTDELPCLKDWIQLRQDGTREGFTYYRWTPCINQKGFNDYFRKVIDYGARELRLDGFHFDNMYLKPCYCPLCHKLFREYLDKNIHNESRLGFLGFKHVDIPPFYHDLDVANDPLQQEWIKFRVQCLDGAMKRLRDHIKSINPDLLICSNPGLPRGLLGDVNRHSVHPRTFGKFNDLIFAENGNFPRVEKDGTLITQIRAFRLSESVGYRVLPTAWIYGGHGLTCPTKAHQVKLSLAEAAAFGGIAGSTWGLRTTRGKGVVLDAPELANALQEYLAFLDHHRDLYQNSKSHSKIALLYDFNSMAYGGFDAMLSFLGMEQVLIEKSIPYSVLFSEDIQSIKDFDLLIVAHQNCLSDPLLETILKFAETGGKLILTGESGVRTEYWIKRETHGFLSVLKSRNVAHLPDRPEQVPVKESEKWIYFNAIPLPKGGRKILQHIQKLCGPSPMPIKIQSKDRTLGELRMLPDQRIVLHLVRYRNEGRPGTISIKIDPSLIRPKAGFKIHVPEEKRPRTGVFTNGKTIEIKNIDTYAIVEWNR